MPEEFLRSTIPFRFLEPAKRSALLEKLQILTCDGGTTLVQQGDEEDQRVFLLLDGRVEVLDHQRKTDVRIDTLEAPCYFGERAVLFGMARSLEIRARTDVRCAVMDGAVFLDLVEDSKSFAHSLGTILRDKQGIFIPFDRFMAELRLGVSERFLRLDKLLPDYLRLVPALHRKAHEPEIDLNGLTYAVLRLPRNLTKTFAYFVTDNLPRLYPSPGEMFRPVDTIARRRAVYEMMPGKTMVLVREGLSDLVDFICCLCLFATEARKIRNRLEDPSFLVRLSQAEEVELDRLPLSEEERKGLRNLWGEEAGKRLKDLLLHHEDFRIEIRKQTGYSIGQSEAWTSELAAATVDLLGFEPASLPPDLEVHIISSNTHSVTNCLSPYLADQKEEILAWGRDHLPELCGATWHDDDDLLYAVSRDYFASHPEKAEEREKVEREAGHRRLKNTAFTGIQVDLIDVKRLIGKRIDGGVEPPQPEKRQLIVNIDYAFGQQAERIIANLLTLFGKQIQSINVLGKAGALQGNRGDILVPTAFVEQSADLFEPIPRMPRHVFDRLADRIPDRTLHEGPVLTVPGTLLQNQMMLTFYKHIWRCVGLEMEGFHYCRQIFESGQVGVTRSDMALRFLYYVSDLPLEHSATLSSALRAAEGIPPLYAVTREILTGIFE